MCYLDGLSWQLLACSIRGKKVYWLVSKASAQWAYIQWFSALRLHACRKNYSGGSPGVSCEWFQDTRCLSTVNSKSCLQFNLHRWKLRSHRKCVFFQDKQRRYFFSFTWQSEWGWGRIRANQSVTPAWFTSRSTPMPSSSDGHMTDYLQC